MIVKSFFDPDFSSFHFETLQNQSNGKCCGTISQEALA